MRPSIFQITKLPICQIPSWLQAQEARAEDSSPRCKKQSASCALLPEAWEKEKEINTALPKARRAAKRSAATGDKIGSVKIKADFVVEGAIRNAGNARRFVEDALFLYEARRYGIACIAAVMAIENIGRARRLLELVLRDNADPKSAMKAEVDAKELKKAVRTDHVSSIRDGLAAIRVPHNKQFSAFDKSYAELQSLTPDTAEYEAALNHARRTMKKAINRTINGIHSSRTVEQYVEPDSKCTAWNEPRATGKDTRLLISNANTNHQWFAGMVKSNEQLLEIVAQKGMLADLESLRLPILTREQRETP